MTRVGSGRPRQATDLVRPLAGPGGRGGLHHVAIAPADARPHQRQGVAVLALVHVHEVHVGAAADPGVAHEADLHDLPTRDHLHDEGEGVITLGIAQKADIVHQSALVETGRILIESLGIVLLPDPHRHVIA